MSRGLYTQLAVFCLLAFSGAGAQALTMDLGDEFRGVKATFPDGTSKVYPDHEIWSFAFFSDQENRMFDGPAADGDCTLYTTPFRTNSGSAQIPAELRYDPFSIQPDGLHITANLLSSDSQAAYITGGAKRFGSGLLLTRFTFSYGKIRINARLPSAKGAWPRVLLIPEDLQALPEIDLLNGVGQEAHHGQIHAGITLPKGEEGGFAEWYDIGVDPSAAFHEYGLDWGPDTITGTFDGKTLWQKPTPPSLKEKDMFLLIQFTVGGVQAFDEMGLEDEGTNSPARMTAGAEQIAKDYPAEMIVKSVNIAPPAAYRQP